MSKNLAKMGSDGDGDQSTQQDDGDKKPAILQAVELIISRPSQIKAATHALHGKYRCRHGEKLSADDIRDMVARKIIRKYSHLAAFSGGATAFTGIAPGLGTLISTFGGATADVALCIKFHVEMTMALTTLHGHDVETEEARQMCFIIAGVGLSSKAAKDGAKEVTAKAFHKLVNRHLSGVTLAAVKASFKTVGLAFTRKAVEKAIPFGVGAVIGFSANKSRTSSIGEKTHDYFKTK